MHDAVRRTSDTGDLTGDIAATGKRVSRAQTGRGRAAALPGHHRPARAHDVRRQGRRRAPVQEGSPRRGRRDAGQAGRDHRYRRARFRRRGADTALPHSLLQGHVRAPARHRHRRGRRGRRLPARALSHGRGPAEARERADAGRLRTGCRRRRRRGRRRPGPALAGAGALVPAGPRGLRCAGGRRSQRRTPGRRHGRAGLPTFRGELLAIYDTAETRAASSSPS